MAQDISRGEPGEPGKPGEPGERGGGKGGHGGAGGRGGHAYDIGPYRRVVIFGTIVAIALSVGTLVLLFRVDANNQNIRKLQEKNRQQDRAVVTALFKADEQRNAAVAKINEQQDVAIEAARRAEFRICQRQMTTRAALALDRFNDEPQLPLLDCRPNLQGKAAHPLTPSERAALLKQVKAGKAP